MDEKNRRNWPQKRRYPRENPYSSLPTLPSWRGYRQQRPRYPVQSQYRRQLTHRYDVDEVRAQEEKRRTTTLVVDKLLNLTAEDKTKSMKQLLVEPVLGPSNAPALALDAKRIAHVKKPTRPSQEVASNKTKHSSKIHQANVASHQKQVKRKVFRDLIKIPINDLKVMATHPRNEDRLILSQLLRRNKKEISEAMRKLAESKLHNRMQTEEGAVFIELENLVDTDIAVDLNNMPVETIQAFQRFFDLDLECESQMQVQGEGEAKDPYRMEDSTDEDNDDVNDSISNVNRWLEEPPYFSPHETPRNKTETPIVVGAKASLNVPAQRLATQSNTFLNKGREKTENSSSEVVQPVTVTSVLTSINVDRCLNACSNATTTASPTRDHFSPAVDEVSSTLLVSPSTPTLLGNNRGTSLGVTKASQTPRATVDSSSELYLRHTLPLMAKTVGFIDVKSEEQTSTFVEFQNEQSSNINPTVGSVRSPYSSASQTLPFIDDLPRSLLEKQQLPSLLDVEVTMSEPNKSASSLGGSSIITKPLQTHAKDLKINSEANDVKGVIKNCPAIVSQRSFMTQTPFTGVETLSIKTQTPRIMRANIGTQTISHNEEVMDCTVASSCDPVPYFAEKSEDDANDPEVKEVTVNSLGLSETSIVNEFQNFITDIRRMPQRSELRRKVANHMIRVMTSSFNSYHSLFMDPESS